MSIFLITYVLIVVSDRIWSCVKNYTETYQNCSCKNRKFIFHKKKWFQSAAHIVSTGRTKSKIKCSTGLYIKKKKGVIFRGSLPKGVKIN